MRLIYPTILLLLLTGCQIFQDVAGKYNTYFLAHERMLEVEQKLFPLIQEDLIHYLPITTALDTAKGRGMIADLNYIIKKASIPIRILKRSKWVDDCYLLIGKARLYQGDFQNAIITFNYIVNNSSDPNARHAALVMLLKTFMFTRELNNFYFVKNHILQRENVFNSKNSKDYHLALAHFYYEEDEYDKVLDHINLTLSHLKTRVEKAHYHYLLGQIYEKQNELGFAYVHYKKTKRLSSKYLLFFHAQIHAYRLQYIKTARDSAKVMVFYQRLLKEDKNWELRDKIYYEMANYQLQNKNYDQAIVFYKECINLSNNSGQKGYAFFQLAKLYEDQFKDYRSAANYYDSATQSLPKHYEVYSEVAMKSDIFRNFSKYYDLAKKQKKLINLYPLPKKNQKEIFEKEIAEEKEILIRQIELTKLNKVRRRPPQTSDANFAGKQEEGGWYFYNSKNKILGTSGFLRIWGDRPLVDNWRLLNKLVEEEEEIKTPSLQNFNKQDKKTKNKGKQNDVFANIIPLEERMSEIPKNSTQLEQLKKELAHSLLNLGISYQDDLNQYTLAFTTFEEIIQKYKSQEVQALYFAYLLCRDHFDLQCNSDIYKSKLFKNYPSNPLAKIIRNPNYEEQDALKIRKVSRIYYRIYKDFEGNNLEKALEQIDDALKTYPNSDYEDKFYLLKTIILGKKKDYKAFKEALEYFIRSFKNSPLRSQAELLLEKYNKAIQEREK